MIFHIDMSNQYNQKNYSCIGIVSVDSKNKKDRRVERGFVISDPLRKELLSKYGDINLHAVLVSMLLKDFIPFRKSIICADIKPIERVISRICLLHPRLVMGHIKSISELREEIGDSRYKSEADAFVKRINRSYNKRKNQHRKSEIFDDKCVRIINSDYILIKDLKEGLEKMRSLIESNR